MREPSFNEFVKDVLIILSFAAKAFLPNGIEGEGGNQPRTGGGRKGKWKWYYTRLPNLKKLGANQKQI